MNGVSRRGNLKSFEEPGTSLFLGIKWKNVQHQFFNAHRRFKVIHEQWLKQDDNA